MRVQVQQSPAHTVVSEGQTGSENSLHGIRSASQVRLPPRPLEPAQEAQWIDEPTPQYTQPTTGQKLKKFSLPANGKFSARARPASSSLFKAKPQPRARMPTSARPMPAHQAELHSDDDEDDLTYRMDKRRGKQPLAQSQPRTTSGFAFPALEDIEKQPSRHRPRDSISSTRSEILQINSKFDTMTSLLQHQQASIQQGMTTMTETVQAFLRAVQEQNTRQPSAEPPAQQLPAPAPQQPAPPVVQVSQEHTHHAGSRYHPAELRPHVEYHQANQPHPQVVTAGPGFQNSITPRVPSAPINYANAQYEFQQSDQVANLAAPPQQLPQQLAQPMQPPHQQAQPTAVPHSGYAYTPRASQQPQMSSRQPLPQHASQPGEYGGGDARRYENTWGNRAATAPATGANAAAVGAGRGTYPDSLHPQYAPTYAAQNTLQQTTLAAGMSTPFPGSFPQGHHGPPNAVPEGRERWTAPAPTLSQGNLPFHPPQEFGHPQRGYPQPSAQQPAPLEYLQPAGYQAAQPAFNTQPVAPAPPSFAQSVRYPEPGYVTPQAPVLAAPAQALIDCGDGYYTTRPSQDEVDAEVQRAKTMGGDMKFRADEIGYFNPRVTNTDENGLNTYQGKTTYKHIRHFLESVNGALTTLPDHVVRAHLFKCLQGDALAWYNGQLPPGGKQFVKLGKGIENWTKLLTEKFKRTNSEIQRELQSLQFTDADLRSGKSITAFAVTVARNLQEWNTGGASDPVRDEQKWIATIYDKLDASFRLTIPDPTENPALRYDQFVKMIEQRAKTFREQQQTKPGGYSNSSTVTRPFNSSAQTRFTQQGQGRFGASSHPSRANMYGQSQSARQGYGNPNQPNTPQQQSAGNAAPYTQRPAQAIDPGRGQGQSGSSQQRNWQARPPAPNMRGGGAPGGFSRPQRALMVQALDDIYQQLDIDQPAPNNYQASAEDAPEEGYYNNGGDVSDQWLTEQPGLQPGMAPEDVCFGADQWSAQAHNAPVDPYYPAYNGNAQTNDGQASGGETFRSPPPFDPQGNQINFTSMAMAKPEFIAIARDDERDLTNDPRTCATCEAHFKSNNKLFAHLKESGHGVSKNTRASHMI
ncbi:hypothetical protein HBI04_146050 [Parastagonospora nodorum]|nr:hypothetical protein HBI03_146700 [Parastagonospora nodorum]KAH4271990.1 hypothetical protein HBI04_146050 [Parastagonospora nodorum]KAH5479557.1 hypothetical protein HBI28_045410 [Parastagonospora nodorum]KAH5642808.1 hypothetical protein HBI22_049620 [Parastagonospora nodorum]KAH5664983.1 hypothetical protein HBI44_229390 [Parastagonospora nodorum]